MSRISRDMRDYLNFFYELVQKRGKIVVDFPMVQTAQLLGDGRL